ncbi:MAG: NUDIX domain-containing protein, partial [Opitutales bacterium]|nr:NUDIX domain-containing protein [Opitutales bacterium]
RRKTVGRSLPKTVANDWGGKCALGMDFRPLLACRPMLFVNPPPDFEPAFEAVSCLISEGDDYLFLHRAPEALHPSTWGCPTGKVDPGEERAAAVRREVREETGIDLPEDAFTFRETLAVRFPEFDFIYHLYTARLADRPKIRLNRREHINYAWLPLEKARRHNLVPDMDAVLDRVENRSAT